MRRIGHLQRSHRVAVRVALVAEHPRHHRAQSTAFGHRVAVSSGYRRGVGWARYQLESSDVAVRDAVVVAKERENKKAAFGFNAATEEYMDLIEAGIIDPTKVTRTALQNAASIAGLMITTECVITDKPEEDKKMGGMPGGMGGGMGGMGGGDMY